MSYKMKHTDGKKASPAKFFGKESPAKNKVKRAAAATRAEDAMSAMNEQLGKEYKSTSLLKSKSPAKKIDIKWDEIVTDAIGSVVQAGTEAGIGALAKGKKKKTKANAPGASMGSQQYGGGSKIA